MKLENDFIVRIFKAIWKNVISSWKGKYKYLNISWFDEKYYKHVQHGKLYKHKIKNDLTVSFIDPLGFLHAAKEIFQEEIYAFDSTIKQLNIIDCGGYIGLSALYFSYRFPNAKITVFEPDSVNFQLAKANLDTDNFPNISLVNAAVWIENGEVSFNATNNMGSSILQSSTNEQTNTKVKAIRLRDHLESRVDFLKIDIEGAEFDVLLDIEDKLFNIEKLFIEYHGTYNEMHKLNKILEILLKNHFYYYIKEAHSVYDHPFLANYSKNLYDIQLNIFAIKKYD